MEEDVISNFIDKKKSLATEYIAIIEELMGDHDSYGYAESTLMSIYDYILENDNITQGQIEAIEHIKEKPSKKRYGW